MLKVRPCSRQDFAEVVGLMRQLWPDKHLRIPRLRTVFARALASASQRYLCATYEDRIVGFGSLTRKNTLWPEGHLGYVDELVVDSEHRGQGVGTRLLQQLADVARRMGCCRIELDSAFYRKESHRFYERHAFKSRAFVYSKPLASRRTVRIHRGEK